MYAIVDIETTGGYAAANGITEICIIVHDGERVVSRFESLINPLITIPRYIQAMTGITDEMVEDAPQFHELAPTIYELLHDKIFVAHNVNFDYSFVKAQLGACGYELNTQKLCTVRLSRKIIPGLPSYGLGNLCHSLGIIIENRHRAGGDTEATAKLFSLLLEKDTENFLKKSLTRNSKEQLLPPNVPKEHFDQLPYSPGVYYFHNDKGKIVYVGKAKNIRYRVNSHFSNNSSSRQKQNFMRHIHAISYKECATELMANILESTEIKKLWPIFNSSQKRREDNYGIYAYEDQNGYRRLLIEKSKQLLPAVANFHYLVDGQAMLRRLVKDFQLCPRLCFIQTDPACEGIKEGTCTGACEQAEPAADYNARVDAAIASLQDTPSFAIIEKGLTPDQQSCVLVWQGKFYGMGYISSDEQVTQPEAFLDLVTQYKENLFIRNLVHNYASKNPHRVKQLVG